MSWYIIDVNAEAMGNEWLKVVDRGMLQFMVVRSKWTAVIIYSMEVVVRLFVYLSTSLCLAQYRKLSSYWKKKCTKQTWYELLTFPFMSCLILGLSLSLFIPKTFEVPMTLNCYKDQMIVSMQ